MNPQGSILQRGFSRITSLNNRHIQIFYALFFKGIRKYVIFKLSQRKEAMARQGLLGSVEICERPE